MSQETPASAVRPTGARERGGTSLAGLVGIELRRLWWRRLTKVALVVLVAFSGMRAISLYEQTSPSTVAQRVADYTSQVGEMRRQQDAMPAADKAAALADCQRQQAAQQRDTPNDPLACDRMFALPSPEAFGIVNTAPGELLRGLAQEGALLSGFLAFLVGASLVAAEFASGSMSTWLTFQPRRLRVATAKLAAAAAGGAVIGALGVGLAAAAVAFVTALNRPDSALQLPAAPVVTADPLALSLLRVVVAVALGGLGGAAAAFLLRSTAGVMGAVLGYAVVVEGFVADAVADGRLKPWLASLNIESFLRNGAQYSTTACDANGCQGTQLTQSYTHGWVYLLALSIVGVGAALLAFQRRDVT